MLQNRNEESGWRSQIRRHGPKVALGLVACCLSYVVLTALTKKVPQPWERWFELPLVPSTRRVEEAIKVKPDGGELNYDCVITSPIWQVAWPLTQKAWCCRVTGRGCPPNNDYDCGEHLDKWRVEWPLDKQYFCCGYALEGCNDFGSLPAEEDCSYEMEDVDLWSPAKQQICCDRFGFGCASSGAAPVAESPQGSKTGGTGCDALCDFGGAQASCKDRVGWVVSHPPSEGGLQGRPNACTEALQKVTGDCPVCSGCPREQVGCGG